MEKLNSDVNDLEINSTKSNDDKIITLMTSGMPVNSSVCLSILLA